MIGKLLLGLWILRWISYIGDPVVAQKWPVFLDESLDERNDVEIFRSVVESMRLWELHKKSHHRAKREVSKVCYEDVGCFEDTGPFSYLEMLPSPPKDVGTRFLVYGSRKARSIPMEVPAEDINDSAHRAIDPDLPTKVIVHGFGSGCDHVWVYEMKTALMQAQECNIVCVDWGPGSAVPNYVRAAANTRLVGRQLAKLIRSLNVPLEKVHLIGFSLGAHVAGFAGAELGNVSRITGLDPAGPLFESQDPRARLDETDANFVDVIHSNGEQLLLGGLGSWQPMGDVDFYPNGGRMQSGCSNLFVGAVSDIIWSSTVEGRSLCNHRRAYKLFTDSVSPKCRFPAFPCDHGYDGLVKGDCFPCGANDRPCGDMGYYSDKSAGRGQLYLITREEEPFCAHQYQVKVYNSKSERPTRSYGKLQVTLVGEGSFNDTFAMTKKDEELLVGNILQKIVVPHPAINSVEAIEIKYTAYSGWISSGLVSWSIDKVAIMDSSGKTLSICKRGLILESGRPVYLPLYPIDCNVPSEPENSTLSMPSASERMVQDKQGIGPFTKEQNYERSDAKDNYPFDVYTNERSTPRKSLGPFTKEQNLRIVEIKDSYKSPSKYDEPDNRRGGTNPWTIVDISGDGDSNSLENLESEKGRGFSGTNFIQRSSESIDRSTETTTEYLPEIREPVLRLSKKETGRSLRLPEITEPILRPRPARQNARNDQDKRQQDEIQETSSTSSRAFTVQFLPERLAGILAQAERYARQTLLPLISQYTPSFVTGIRHDEPKYFPPLGDTVKDAILERSRGTSGREFIDESQRSDSNEQFDRPADVNDDQREIQPVTSQESENNDEQVREGKVSDDTPIVIEAIYPEKEIERFNSSSESQQDKFDSPPTDGSEWIPIEPVTVVNKLELGSRRDANVSRSLNWKELESHTEWTSRIETIDSETETKIADWMPITERNSMSSARSVDSKEDIATSTNASIEPENDTAERSKMQESVNSDQFVMESTTRANDNRKFIPLVDFEDSSIFFSSTASDSSVLESHTSTAAPATHIQKIPRPTTVRTIARIAARTMVFPYAYERRKDPRTRYIPLIPEEDFGRSGTTIERDRGIVA